MSNELSILGFGQCGSKVAVEISASFNPTNILKGDSIFGFCFKYMSEKIGRQKREDIGQSPAFYIADLNTSNDVYIYFTKAQAIRDNLNYINNMQPREIIERINKNNKGVLLEEGDTEIVEKVKKQNEALKMVTALYFESNSKPLLEFGGAGGLQYLSEAIAEQDTKLLKSIDTRQGGALIGIFSLGGGTGSGSLFSILTKYKNLIHRYTVGVGVIPNRENTEEFANAGRYLTKYLGSRNEDRFHTLILFSNEAARDVIIDEKMLDNANPLSLINNYITSFIHDFSMINDNKTITQFGKLFDPMDGKRFLSGICTIGYSYSDDFSAKELFVNAISPMAYENKCLSGIAIRLTNSQHDRTKENEIKNLLLSLINKIDEKKDIKEINEFDEINEIRSITPFYRTIKTVRLFYFIKNTDYQSEAYKFQRTISQFFQHIAGDDVSVSINCYFTPESESRNNSLLIIIGGAFSFEIYESVIKYTKQSFVQKDKDDEVKDVEDSFNELLDDVKRTRSSGLPTDISNKVDTILTDCNCSTIEGTKSKDNINIFDHPDVKSFLNAEKLEKILLKREKIKTAFEEIVENFTLGEKKFETKINPFDDF